MDREYNKNAFLQRTFGEQLVENISYCCRLLPTRSEYQVADFGCGPGANSVKPLSTFIENMPPGVLSKAFMVDYQQDPELWNQLSSTLDGAKLKVGSYVQVQNSFYKPLDASAGPFLDLAWSSTAIHWTSRVSCELEDYFTPLDLPTGSQQRIQWAADADEDWRTFLRNRAAEILRGGFLLITVPGVSVDGIKPLLDTFRLFAEVKKQMLADGVITRQECARLVLPCWERTTKELLGPLLEEGSDLSSFFGIERYQIEHIKCPQAAALREGRTSPAEFAAAYAAALRAVLNGVIAAALPAAAGEATGENARVDEYWRRVTAEFEARPPSGRNAHVHHLVLRRL